MQIYLSASSDDPARAQQAMDLIRAAGHEIIVDWLHEAPDQTTEIWGVLGADVLIALCPLSPGCLIEIGAALASVTPVVLVGDWDHWFSTHPCFKARASSIEAALPLLEVYDGE